MIKYGLILTCLFLNLSKLSAQSSSDNCVKSTEGKEFWFGFMENRLSFGCPIPPPANYLEITVTSRFDCQFIITLGKSAVPIVSGVLQPNIPQKIRLDRLKTEPFGSENIEEKAIHLVSDQPLNLYAMNWGINSADAAVIFPVEALGSEYYALCYEPHVDIRQSLCGSFFNGKNSEFVVVASEDQTQVTITPSKVTDQLKPANIPYTITLNRGELYQVQSMNMPNLAGQGDLTGTYIKSDKPIALYSGSWSTTVPNTSVSAWDHLYEQIPPLRSWGRKFVTVPIKYREKDTYRILASVDQTTVKIVGKTTVVINKGEFYEFMLNSNEPSLIESDQPVLLAQYSNSNDVDRPPGVPQALWDGDPSMLIISPVDHTRENVTFVAYDTPEITNKLFVNVVTKDDAVNQIQLDNQTISFTSFPNSGYSYAQVQIVAGSHNLNSTEAGKGFIAYVYGFGGVESYGYGVGFNLSTRLDLGGDIHFVKDTILLCKGEPKILNAGSHFSSFKWNTGETTQKISVSDQGYYKVTASTLDGCVLADSIYAVESNPVVSFGKDTTLCDSGPLLLDAGNFSSYRWSTSDTIRTILVKTPGLYSVSVVNKYGCTSRDTIRVNMTEQPKLKVTRLDSLLCGSKTMTVDITADKGSYTLKSSDPSVVFHGLTATVPNYGTYPFTFIATDQYSCAADTNFTVRFRKNSSIDIQIDSTCFRYSLDAKYLGDAVLNNTRFTWIFAGDTISNGIGKDQIHIQLGSNHLKDELSLQLAEEGCQSQKVIRIIDVSPDLNFAPSDTVVCLSGELKFTATNSANAVDYEWNWGDGIVEHLSGNAVHRYTKEGYYDVQLTAKTDKDCTNAIVKPKLITVFPVPKAAFSMDQNIFLTVNPTVSFFNESVGADQYIWRFGDGMTSVEKDPVHQYKAVGSLKVLLEAANNFGCIDTTSGNVSVALTRIYPPNAFSPNAENQIDREFRLYSNGVMAKGYHLKILSRWNDVVFDCKNEIKGWDGKLSDGSTAQPGNYIWILEFIDFLGKAHRQTGTVTLIL